MAKIRKYIRLTCEIDIPLEDFDIQRFTENKSGWHTNVHADGQRITIINAQVKHAKVEVCDDNPD